MAYCSLFLKAYRRNPGPRNFRTSRLFLINELLVSNDREGLLDLMFMQEIVVGDSRESI
jgi:hypothetical protein